MAISFGVMTVISGGYALFGGELGKDFAGNYVSFVLWFNFIAGYLYITSGTLIFIKQYLGVVIAKLLAFSTIVVFMAFLVQIFLGVEYEIRTIGAMSVRSIFWVVVFLQSRKCISIKRNELL